MCFESLQIISLVSSSSRAIYSVKSVVNEHCGTLSGSRW